MCLNSNTGNVQKCIYQGIICTSYLSRFDLEFWLTAAKYSNVGSICNLDNKLWCHVTNYYFFFDELSRNKKIPNNIYFLGNKENINGMINGEENRYKLKQ